MSDSDLYWDVREMVDDLKRQSVQAHAFAHLDHGAEQGLRDFIMEAPVQLVAQGLWEECAGFEDLRVEDLVPHVLAWRLRCGTRPH